MRLRFLPPLRALAMLVAAAAAAAAATNGYLLAAVDQATGRATNANPDNMFALGGGGAELALGLEGEQRGVRWRARLTARGARGDGWPAEHNLSLQELYYRWRIGERWHASAGEQLLAWDNGLAFQPLGFFKSSRTDLRDVFDVEGRSQGLPLLAMTRLGDSVTTDLVVSGANPHGDRAEKLNGRQAALRFSGEPWPGLNAAFVLRKRSASGVGAGISSSYGVGQATLRADAYYGPADARVFPDALLRQSPQVFLPPPAWREQDHPYRWRSVAGFTWTPTRALALYGEWIHKGDGLSGAQWSRYLGQIQAHAAALDGPLGRAARGNLGTDLNVLDSTVAGVRRDYLYLRAELGQGGSLYVSSYAGLADHGALHTVSKTWRLREHTTLRLDASVFTGRADSEFGLTPYRRQAGLTLLHSFD
jgi:hypothetical protein